jgi:hypothetical protein
MPMQSWPVFYPISFFLFNSDVRDLLMATARYEVHAWYGTSDTSVIGGGGGA